VIEITTASDEHVFSVGVKDKGTVFVDGFELSSRCMDIEGVEDGNASRDDLVSALREVAWADDENALGDFSDHELFAVANKVLLHLDALGKK
jgi:hypothetical protein